MIRPTRLLALLALLLLMSFPGVGSAYVSERGFGEVSTFAYEAEEEEYRFLCSTIGDSLTGFSNLQNVFYDRLNNPDYPFRSIPGDTRVLVHSVNGGVTSSILSVINSRDYGAGEGANFVIIMAGTNDVDYSRSDDLDNLANGVLANIQAMVESVLGGQTDPNTRPAVIVAGIPGFTDQEAESRAKYINDLLRTHLDRIDVFTDETWWSLYDPTTETASASLMTDNKHPNRDGFYRIAEAWFKAVDALYDPSRFDDNPHLHKMGWYFQRR